MKLIFLLLWIFLISTCQVFAEKHLEKGTCNSTITCSSLEEVCCNSHFCCKDQANDTDIDLNLCRICPESNSCCSKGRCCYQIENKGYRLPFHWAHLMRLLPIPIIGIIYLSFLFYRRRQRQNFLLHPPPVVPNVYTINNNPNYGQPPAYTSNQQLFVTSITSPGAATNNQQFSYQQDYSSIPPPISNYPIPATNPPPYS